MGNNQIKINEITTETWQNMVKQASSRSGGRTYLAIRSEDGIISTFSDKSEMKKDGFRKMSLAQINALSLAIIKQPDVPQVNKAMIGSCVDIINSQTFKNYNSTVTKVKEFFQTLLEVLCYFTVVGIPIGIVLADRRNENLMQSEIDLSKANEFIRSLSAKDKELIKLVKKRPELVKLIEKLPALLEEINDPKHEKWHDENITLCQTSLEEDVREARQTTETWAKFYSDQSRGGIAFRLITHNVGLFSRGEPVEEWAQKHPGSSEVDPAHKQTDDADRYIASLYQQIDSFLPNLEERKRWKPVVAALLTQAMPCAIKGPLGGALMSLTDKTDNNIWNAKCQNSTVTIEEIRDGNALVGLKCAIMVDSQLESMSTKIVALPIGMSSVLQFNVSLDGEKPIMEAPVLTHAIN